MAGISAYDSNSISVLFSSLPGVGGGLSPMGAMSASLSDYKMVSSGSYLRMMKSYFAKTDAEEFRKAFGNTKGKSSNSVSKDSASALGTVKSAAEELEDSASKLVRGTAFNRVSKTDESGRTTSVYDMDKIYDAVKAFADDYNSMVKAADGIQTSGIKSTAVNMINYTSKNASSLNAVGITIDSDYRMSIDTEKFKKADVNTLKSLFYGSGSYANNVKAQASMIGYKAGSEASKSNTYTNAGSFSPAYSAGSMLDSFF